MSQWLFPRILALYVPCVDVANENLLHPKKVRDPNGWKSPGVHRRIVKCWRARTISL
jgi:hypothetical protein